MSRFCIGLALWALVLARAACGGDGKGTDPKDAELAEMVDTVVSTYDDLTVCTDKREGATAYVEDEKKAYVCESKRWTANDSLTESIQNKDSDSAKDAESGENVDTVVPTFDDLPSCTRDHEDATAYVEDEDSAYVCKKGLWIVDDSLTKAIQRRNEKSFSNSQNNKSSSSFLQGSVFPVDNTLATPCKTESEDNCEYDTLRDDRDFETYKIVKIGEQWWMAENLNYRYIQQTFEGGEKDSSSYCYDNDPANCAKYGRLYLWSAAMVVCPEGWHLPSRDEWNTLLTAARGIETAGIMLKSTEGWNDKYDGTSGNGSDIYSFSALPAGIRGDFGYYYNEGNYTYFWGSTEYDSGSACYMNLDYDGVSAYLGSVYKGYGFSVRCLKD